MKYSLFPLCVALVCLSRHASACEHPADWYDPGAEFRAWRMRLEQSVALANQAQSALEKGQLKNAQNLVWQCASSSAHDYNLPNPQFLEKKINSLMARMATALAAARANQRLSLAKDRHNQADQVPEADAG